MLKNFRAEVQRIWKKFIVCKPYFAALGDEMRQRIVLILAEAGLTSHKKGTSVYYFIYIQNTLDKLKDLLTSVEKLVSGIDMQSIKEKAPWMIARDDYLLADEVQKK